MRSWHVLTPLLLISLGSTPVCATKSANVILQEESAVNIVNRLRSHISPHDEVVFATCGLHWSTKDIFWLRRLPWAITKWKLREQTTLRSFVRGNLHRSVRTIVLLETLGEHATTCLNSHFESMLAVYAVEWIVLNPDSESIRTLSRYVSDTPVRNFACGLAESKLNQKGKSAVSVHVAPALFSRSCVEQEGRPLVGKHSELRNTVIRTACIDLRYRGGGGKRDCNSYQTDIIFNAVKLYNVTVVNTFYTTARPLGIDMFHGLIDVHRNLAAARPVSLREFHTPGLIMYWYESFYVKREKLVLLSFQDILDESKFSLALVSVTLVSTMIFLALADALHVGRWDMDALTNSFMFLLASFYSTSYSIPRIGCWTALGALICGVWMMGMLPFSNYFRSELTTRVTLRAFPDHMDTLAKLERALDEKRVVPCVVKDTFLHTRLTSDLFIANFHRKLRSAFRTSKFREELLQPTYSQCLNCALKKGRICYTPSLPSWFRSPYKGEFIESREHVNPILLTIAVRKNYPHLRGLQELIRKIIEGGMLRPPENDLRYGHLQNYDASTSVELSPLMVEEFASFLVVFVALLGATSVIFLAELFIRGRKDGATADVSEA